MNSRLALAVQCAMHAPVCIIHQCLQCTVLCSIFSSSGLRLTMSPGLAKRTPATALPLSFHPPAAGSMDPLLAVVMACAVPAPIRIMIHIMPHTLLRMCERPLVLMCAHATARGARARSNVRTPLTSHSRLPCVTWPWRLCPCAWKAPLLQGYIHLHSAVKLHSTWGCRSRMRQRRCAHHPHRVLGVPHAHNPCPVPRPLLHPRGLQRSPCVHRPLIPRVPHQGWTIPARMLSIRYFAY